MKLTEKGQHGFTHLLMMPGVDVGHSLKENRTERQKAERSSHEIVRLKPRLRLLKVRHDLMSIDILNNVFDVKYAEKYQHIPISFY